MLPGRQAESESNGRDTDTRRQLRRPAAIFKKYDTKDWLKPLLPTAKTATTVDPFNMTPPERSWLGLYL